MHVPSIDVSKRMLLENEQWVLAAYFLNQVLEAQFTMAFRKLKLFYLRQGKDMTWIASRKLLYTDDISEGRTFL